MSFAILSPDDGTISPRNLIEVPVASFVNFCGNRVSSGKQACRYLVSCHMNRSQIKTSKFLSLVLRHQPQAVGLSLDANGWVAIDELLAAAARHGRDISREHLRQVVDDNDKQRFEVSSDGLQIRARQGHSIDVDLELQPCAPPAELFHGTVERFIDSIRRQGLVAGSRQHVHLSRDRETASKVGSRRGEPVILTIDSGAMYCAGWYFYLSSNEVWLTDAVPAKYICFP